MDSWFIAINFDTSFLHYYVITMNLGCSGRKEGRRKAGKEAGLAVKRKGGG